MSLLLPQVRLIILIKLQNYEINLVRIQLIPIIGQVYLLLLKGFFLISVLIFNLKSHQLLNNTKNKIRI